MEDFFKYVEQEGQKVYGWICGKCGRSNAPNVSQCPCSYQTYPNPWPPQYTPNYNPPYTITWCSAEGGKGNPTSHGREWPGMQSYSDYSTFTRGHFQDGR